MKKTSPPLLNRDEDRLTIAARAGWLYYVGGRTQDEIAEVLGVSRPTAQRLVSLAVSEKLITFKFNHPIAACMKVAEAVATRFELRQCEVVPTDPVDPQSLAGVAYAAASLLDQYLATPEPLVIALGTGRAMQATVNRVGSGQRPQHRLVSLVGTISPEGSATHYDAAGWLAHLTGATHYPMPLPVMLPEEGDREALLQLSLIRRIRELAAAADLSMVGIGNVGMNAPLRLDGFLSSDEMHQLMRSGAVGEIVGWSFNAEGQILSGKPNQRTSSIRPIPTPDNLVVGVAVGPKKAAAISAAVRGRLINGLITDETTAAALLKS
jgi:DNA-binding transcriptional regulator LsrR (DeoR family)